MNYLIASSCDNIDNSEAVLMTDNKIVRRLPTDDKYMLMSGNKRWFNVNKIRLYVKLHGWTPCIIVLCDNGNINVNIVSC